MLKYDVNATEWFFKNISLCLDSDTTDEVMPKATAEAMIDRFISDINLSNQVGTLVFYIHHQENVMLFRDLMRYIDSKDRNALKICVKSANKDIFSGDFHQFCVEYRVKTIYEATFDIDQDKIKYFDKVLLTLPAHSIDKLGKTYELLNSNGLKHFEFRFKNLLTINDDFKDKFKTELKYITKIMGMSFNLGQIPLFPDNMIQMMMNVLLSDETNKYTVQEFTYQTSCDYRNNYINSWESVDMSGKVFFGDFDTSYLSAQARQNLYFGEFNPITLEYKYTTAPSDLILEKYHVELEDLYNISTKSESFICDTCPARHGCVAGSVVHNLYESRLPNEASTGFCTYYRTLFEETNRFMKSMDIKKNNTFRDFMYICYATKFDCDISNIIC